MNQNVIGLRRTQLVIEDFLVFVRALERLAFLRRIVAAVVKALVVRAPVDSLVEASENFRGKKNTPRKNSWSINTGPLIRKSFSSFRCSTGRSHRRREQCHCRRRRRIHRGRRRH